MTTANRIPCYLGAMKMKFILTAFALLAASGLAAAATNDVSALVQRGLFEEEANHQLDAAIGDYKEAIEQFDHDRKLAATAIFRLGECYRKQGKTNEAGAQYERIVREFPDQTQLAQLSQGYLPAGGGAAQGAGSLGAGLATMPSDEAEFLRKAIESAQTSPDLVNQELSTAVQSGYVSAAGFLIAHGADVNAEHRDVPPIIEAAQSGNEAMVQLLLSHGAAVNRKNERGRTALGTAVEKGFMAVCRTLLAQGADVNLQSPIHVAIRLGNVAMVQLLLSHGANVNPDPKIVNGQTPLAIAIWRRNSEIVRTLLDNHADANMEASDGPFRRLNPLDWAIYLDQPDVVKLLLEGHADPNAVMSRSAYEEGGPNRPRQPFEVGDAPRWEKSAEPVPGMTPLLWAVSGNPPQAAEIVKLLLDNHADVNVKTPNGSTPFHLAVDMGNLAAAGFLINKAQIDATNNSGEAPLTTAIRHHNGDMVKLLLDNHADANTETTFASQSGRFSPLVWAIIYDHPEIVKLLLDDHADPNAPSSSDQHPQWTPLRWAVNFNRSHNEEITQMLLDHGAKPNAVDSAGVTALSTAIEVGNIDEVRTLIGHGADVNVLDKQGSPPLAYLKSPRTEAGRQIEELLLKAGADADYNRRRGIWTYGAGGIPKAQVFQCPANSINHYTLLEFVATLYEAKSSGNTGGANTLGAIPNARYPHYDGMISFPDFARVTIHRLDGKRAEVLHVNVTDILQSGDRSKDVPLQAGDMVEIPEQEHKVADHWYGLSAADNTALKKYLWRTVHVVTQGKTNDITLLPSFANAVAAQQFSLTEYRTVLDSWDSGLHELLNGRKTGIVVLSFLLDDVARNASVLLNTSDLSRVQLTRGGAKTTFDLTVNPRPDVWLEDGDGIEIPELGEAAPATGAK